MKLGIGILFNLIISIYSWFLGLVLALFCLFFTLFLLWLLWYINSCILDVVGLWLDMFFISYWAARC